MTLELADTVAGVVPERDNKWWLSRSQSLDCPAIANGYFNSGVLLLNIPAWASEHVSGKAMSLLSDKNVTRKLSFMDQDILNIILSGKVTFIDGKYNTQFSLNYELKETFIKPYPCRYGTDSLRRANQNPGTTGPATRARRLF
ncbi:Lipopolysaccharide 1,2-glucosyltransferase [Kluyvera cryocrescens]|uniref:Lipopolysaccharide 1,2-glucosyltransferase n=1 Tax=Kluyvera cryocrescens TaxID=580 RepID=A0A485AK76_KLUCR|nr:Lipopolysaccharide 1,2-glucosyltransferase [Kluyvera cryocrescens]